MAKCWCSGYAQRVPAARYLASMRARAKPPLSPRKEKDSDFHYTGLGKWRIGHGVGWRLCISTVFAIFMYAGVLSLERYFVRYWARFTRHSIITQERRNCARQ